MTRQGCSRAIRHGLAVVLLATATATVLTASVSAQASTPDVLTITSPSTGSTVGGDISVTATVSESVPVDYVEWTLNTPDNLTNRQVQRVDTPPYSATLDTTAIKNGPAMLSIAVYVNDEYYDMAIVNVSVKNSCDIDTATVTAPSSQATVAGRSVELSGTVAPNLYDVTGTTSVLLFLNGTQLPNVAEYNTQSGFWLYTWDATHVPNGTYTLTAQPIVSARCSGKMSPTVRFTVANSNPVPSVSITSPSDDATVRGTITITATATLVDPIGPQTITSVEFSVNGHKIGTSDDPPFSVQWDTTKAQFGVDYTIDAAAHSSAGPVGQSLVSVDVDNDPTEWRGTKADATSGSPGTAYLLTSTLYDDADHDGIGGAPVQLSEAPLGGAVQQLQIGVTQPNGVISFTVKPTVNASYQIRYAGAGTNESAASSWISVTVDPTLKLSVNQGRHVAGRAVTYHVHCLPSEAGLPLLVEQHRGGLWYTIQKIKSRGHGSATFSLLFRSPGSIAIRVVHLADKTYGSASSNTSRIRIGSAPFRSG
jgi:Bacterial Ig domain